MSDLTYPADAMRQANEANCRLAAENIRLAAEVREARRRERDTEQTLNAWFDTRKVSEADLTPRFLEALSGYLRTCRAGGMPAEQSDAAEAILSDFLRKHVGEIVTPFIRQAVEAEREKIEDAMRGR